MCHLFDVDVRLVEAVEQDDGRGSVGIELLDEGHGVGQVAAQLHDDGDADGLLDVPQDVDVLLFEAAVGVLRVGLQGQDVNLQSIGSGLFDLLGEFGPSGVLITVDAGYDGYVAHLLALADEVEVFVQLVVKDIDGQFVAGFGRHGWVVVLEGFHHDLFLEEGLQHDGSCACFAQFPVLFGAVCQA